jgi:agmatinase
MELTWCNVQLNASGVYLGSDGRTSGSDMCILGVPYDGGRSDAGGQDRAPFAIRQLEWLQSWRDRNQGDLDTVRVVDAGDLDIDHRNAAYSLQTNRQVVRNMWQNTNVLTVLGGDHSITSFMLNIANERIGHPVNVVHLDAHTDTWSSFDAHKTDMPTHDSWVEWSFYKKDIGKIWQFGVRALGPPDAHDTHLRRQRVVRPGDLALRSLNGFCDHYLAQHPGEELYLSVDMDVVDPAFCPGVAYPEPGGWTPQMLLRTIETMVKRLPVFAVDIVETTPSLDHNQMSVRLAHRSVLAVVKGLKARQSTTA